MKFQLSTIGVIFLGAWFASTISPAESQPLSPPADKMLKFALTSPQSFMFVEQLTMKLDSKATLWVTSAKDDQRKPHEVRIPTASMRIFRADGDLDDFTKQGGWYWRCGDSEGKSQFESSFKGDFAGKGEGPLIMVVRQRDGTVNWYLLRTDRRC